MAGGKKQPQPPREKVGSRCKARKVQGRDHKWRSYGKKNRLVKLTNRYMDQLKSIYSRISELSSGNWIEVNPGEYRLKNKLRDQKFEDYVAKFNLSRN